MAKKVSKSDPYSVMAPYNFIPTESRTVEVDEKDMLVRGEITDGLVSGEINYIIDTKTPIFVDDGNMHFYRDEYNRQAIPGTTMRGLVRSNALVLGVSDYSDDIDDYRLMFRTVANGAEKEKYNDILGNKPVTLGHDSHGNEIKANILQNVRAGYIANENGKYIIYGTKVKKIMGAMGDVNYFAISERRIKDNYDEDGFAFFKNHPEYLQHDLGQDFIRKEKKGRIQYVGTKNEKYKPYYVRISYENKDKNITAVGASEEYSKKGYLVGTGKIDGKKALYIIPEIDKSKCIDVSKVYENSLNDFKRDFEARKNSIKRYGDVELFNLPKKNNMRPVFYIELGGKLYFGFTPRLRLFYDHNVKEGYRQKISKFDYVKSIFGCIDDKVGYKSKVSFSDAVIIGDEREEKQSKVVLGEPKPSSYLDYLVQREGEVPNTYNTDRFDLRGMKKYWLHNDIVQSDSNANENVKSTINALPEGTSFQGKIRFQNLSEAELGLLIWSLQLEKNSEINIGKAKSYGFGRSKVEDVKVRLFNLSKAYNTEKFEFEPFDNETDGVEYIAKFKDEIGKKLGKDIDELESVKALLLMSNAERIPADELTRYMRLENREYQSRVRDLVPLPSLQEVVFPGENNRPRNNQGNRNNNGNRNNQRNRNNNNSDNRSRHSNYNREKSEGNRPFAELLKNWDDKSSK